MLIICQNDFPLFVCPENTTPEDAGTFAKVLQTKKRDVLASSGQRDTGMAIHIHVQRAEMLSETAIEEMIK